MVFQLFHCKERLSMSVQVLPFCQVAAAWNLDIVHRLRRSIAMVCNPAIYHTEVSNTTFHHNLKKQVKNYLFLICIGQVGKIVTPKYVKKPSTKPWNFHQKPWYFHPKPWYFLGFDPSSPPVTPGHPRGGCLSSAPRGR